jgi:hypothetical protein
MHTRPATPAEILAYCRDHVKTFERGCMETTDHRTESGVRHIRRNRSRVRNVDGVPMVVCNGQLCQLFGQIIVFSDGDEAKFPACLSIIPSRDNGGIAA